MRDNDGAPVGVVGQHRIAPRQHFRRRVGIVLEIQHDKVQPADAEKIIMIVVVGAIVARVILAPGKVRHAKKPVIVAGGSTDGVPIRRLLVVAHGHAIGHAIRKLRPRPVFQAVHGIGRVIPLRDVGGGVPVVDNIAELGHVRDVAGRPVVNRPFRLGNHHLLRAVVSLRRVILSVGHDHDAEIRPHRRGGCFAPVKGHAEIARQGLGNGHLQKRRHSQVLGLGIGRHPRRDGRRDKDERRDRFGSAARPDRGLQPVVRRVAGLDHPAITGGIRLVADNIISVVSAASFGGKNQDAAGGGMARDFEFPLAGAEVRDHE